MRESKVRKLRESESKNRERELSEEVERERLGVAGVGSGSVESRRVYSEKYIKFELDQFAKRVRKLNPNTIHLLNG